jgi:plasmid stabilization system protein ParE
VNARFGHSIYVFRYRVIDRQVIVTRILHGRERR